MLLTVTVAWLVLSVLASAACALVARGGLREDGRRGFLDTELALLVAAAPADGDARALHTAG